MDISVRTGLGLSLVLHVAVVTVAVAGLPHLLVPPAPLPEIIPVELVTLAEETRLAPARAEEQPEDAEAKPAPRTEAAPLPETAEAVPLPGARPKAKAPKAISAPLPRVRPKPPPRNRFEVTRIAALLDKRRQERPRAPAPLPEAAKSKQAGPDQRLTISEVDAVRLQIQSCWSLPAGARDAEGLIVRLRIFLNPDGSLARPPQIVNRDRLDVPGQDFFRTAAESAVRAVRKCEPLIMPANKYELWRDMVLTFDPREMFGG